MHGLTRGLGDPFGGAGETPAADAGMLARMGCRGALFAIPPETAEALRAADDDEALMERVDELEEAWEEPFVAETDKAWDAIHRALSDGTLDPEGGEAPLDEAPGGSGE